LPPNVARRGVARLGELGALVDVRDTPELAAGGKLKGAVNASRGMLEFRADPESPYYNPSFQKDKTVLVYCGSGGRAALSARR